MDPVTIVVVFFILKAVGIGKGFATLKKLESFRDEVYKEGAQQEVNTVLLMFIGVHSAMGLLQAATCQPSQQADPPGSAPQDGHIITAYEPDEIGDDGTSGWFSKATSAIADVRTDDLGKLLASKVIQKVQVGPATDPRSVPLLQLFLERYRKQGQLGGFDPAGFDPVATLEACRKSVPQGGQGGFHSESPHYTAMALGLLQLLWGPDAGRNLSEVDKWISKIGDLDGTQDWLSKELRLGSLSNEVGQLYTSGNDEAKWALSRIARMLDTNVNSYFAIYDKRLDTQGGEWLPKTIDIFKTNATQNQKQAWDRVLWATYGAIAWKIFRQASLAVWKARIVLES